MSHLGNNHTVKMRLGLGPPIHFIHMSGKHYIYIKCVWYTLYAADGHKDTTRTEDNELKHNNQHYVGMNGPPPFSNLEDDGQLHGQTRWMTTRKTDKNEDNKQKQGRRMMHWFTTIDIMLG